MLVSLFVHMYVWLSVCRYVCLPVYICLYVCLFICLYVCLFVCLHRCLSVSSLYVCVLQKIALFADSSSDDEIEDQMVVRPEYQGPAGRKVIFLLNRDSLE